MGMTTAAGMPPQPQPSSPSSSKRSVAIVGGGFAGLAAAHTLLQRAGADSLAVSLFEAGAQVGGRARTGQLAAGPVELGATWFHGTVGNPVYDLSQQLRQQQLHTRQPAASTRAAAGAAPAAAAASGDEARCATRSMAGGGGCMQHRHITTHALSRQ